MLRYRIILQMKPAALIISTLVFLSFAQISSAGDSSATVKINNKINTGSSTSTYSSNTSTKIDIENDGGGTSQVTINGKEYKVEGEGELHIDENSSSTNTPKPTSVSQTEATEEPSPSATPSESPESEVLGATSLPSFTEILESRIEELKEMIREFFDNLF